MREFTLAEVLAMATGRMLVLDMKELVSYMWGRSCEDNLEYIAMYPECKLWTLKQYPQFGGQDIVPHLNALDLSVANPGTRTNKEVVLEWIASLVPKYGDSFPIKRIPEQNRCHIDIREEAHLVMGPDRVIEV